MFFLFNFLTLVFGMQGSSSLTSVWHFLFNFKAQIGHKSSSRVFTFRASIQASRTAFPLFWMLQLYHWYSVIRTSFVQRVCSAGRWGWQLSRSDNVLCITTPFTSGDTIRTANQAILFCFLVWTFNFTHLFFHYKLCGTLGQTRSRRIWETPM